LLATDPVGVLLSMGNTKNHPRASRRASVLALLVCLIAVAYAKKDVLVEVKDAKSVIKLRAICSRSRLGYDIRRAAVGLPSDVDCRMPELCKRIYTKTVIGFAGSLDDDDWERLQRCMPDSIVSEEDDQTVVKLEGMPNPLWMGGNRTLGDEISSFSGDSQVDYKEINPEIVSKYDTEDVPNELWSVDRVDQASLPLDGHFKSNFTGKGVTIYVVDSGIRTTHQEFQGGVRSVIHGWDFVEDDGDIGDCDGHGSHVAGTAAGRGVGVAKDANVVGVRILNCDGDGKVSDTIAALDWVAEHHSKNSTGPGVVVMSLGIVGPSQGSKMLERATRALVDAYGITVVVAAGNAQLDSCTVSPANVDSAITVAATDIPNKYERSSGKPQQDVTYFWGNMGSCLDIFAPGVQIYSVCGGAKRCSELSDQSYTMATGSSMAAPLVAGAAAVYLEAHPAASPAEVKEAILGGATLDAINEGYFPPELWLPGTPNKLLKVVV
jgi:subtilisin family serine protease